MKTKSCAKVSTLWVLGTGKELRLSIWVESGAMFNVSIVGRRCVILRFASYFCFACIFNGCVISANTNRLRTFCFIVAKVLRPGLIKGKWSKREDRTIIDCIKMGITKSSAIAERIPGHIGKQCRERWYNHVDPSIKKGKWIKEEDELIVACRARMGLCNLSPSVSA